MPVWLRGTRRTDAESCPPAAREADRGARVTTAYDAARLEQLRKYRDETDEVYRLWASEPVWVALVEKLEAENKAMKAELARLRAPAEPT